MGMAKREHIAAILAIPEVEAIWHSLHGRDVEDQDIELLYQQFLPLQEQVIARHCELIPGALTTYQWLKQQNIRVASTTGYTRAIMQVVTGLARQAGYDPEVVLCAEDAPFGRPAPWLIFECAKRLNVYPISSIVKVDDTLVGIEAGINAGAWTVGIARSGNLVGLSEAELGDLDSGTATSLVRQAREKLIGAGAHFVIDSVQELPDVISRINVLLEQRRPSAVPTTVAADA
jgi:phosphonoacetaldehyde hydrolase